MQLNKQVSLSIKMLGKRRPIIEKKPLALSLDFQQQPTLANFLRLVVTQEVNTFNNKVDTINLLPYLDGKTIKRMANHGKISFGAIYRKDPAEIEQAIKTALQAFEDGLFLVLIDGTKLDTLDQIIQFKDNSEVVFLRLVALAGGYF